METSKQLKNREIIFLDALFTILTVIVVFLPLLLIFDHPSSPVTSKPKETAKNIIDSPS